MGKNDEKDGNSLTIEQLRVLVEAVDSSAVNKLRLHEYYKDCLNDCPLSRHDVEIVWWCSHEDTDIMFDAL